MRSVHAGCESATWGVSGGSVVAGVGIRFAYPDCGAGGRHGMDGDLFARLEHVEATSKDAARGRCGVPGDGSRGSGGECGGGDCDRVFDLWDRLCVWEDPLRGGDRGTATGVKVM